MNKRLTTAEIKSRYLSFFQEKKHRQILPAPLVLEGDPTTLFTSAGMQPLIPYLKGEIHPDGKRLVDSQPSLRLQDIDEVGDNRHTTFFEMLGNWSLGDYFKKEQLEWCLQFFTEELGLDKSRLWVSVFEGTDEVPKDEESYNRWLELGIPKEKIHLYGVGKNWWSRSGSPEKMPAGEIGGPDSEVFYDFGNPVHEGCHPNCDCGRFLEIGNSVFIQYEKQADGKLKELPQKNVDFGGGLERIAMAVGNEPDIFKIDIFKQVVSLLEEKTGINYDEKNSQIVAFRIIADHLRASIAIASEGILPGNKLQGHILRRLIRRSATKTRQLLSKSVVDVVGEIVQILGGNDSVKKVITDEVFKFEKILLDGIRLVKQNPDTDPFELYQSYGIPYEISREIFLGIGVRLTEEKEKEFEEKLKKHREESRIASAGMFKGGLADASQEVTKLHTATHLLHASLRKILGETVSQKGSNITNERLRFDFSHPQKLTEDELGKVESLINEQIQKDLPVTFETMTLSQAKNAGALHFFAEKYGDKVKVYSIGSVSHGALGDTLPFSREICGGPHVKNIGSIGHVRIIKQEKIASGVVRIYATNK